MLDRLTSTESASVSTLVVPVGSVEQHGPHLPLSTDSIIAGAVCDRVVDQLPEAAVAPCVEYASSGEHEGFPGTVSIGREALQLLLIELCRSASRWVDRIVLVSGHGGNVPSLIEAGRLLRDECRDVMWTTCAEPGWDAHAGLAETSLMLAVRPDQVHHDRALPGADTALQQLWPTLRRDGVAAVSPNGVLGDPRGATAAHGAALLDRLVQRISGQVISPQVGADGALKREPARGGS